MAHVLRSADSYVAKPIETGRRRHENRVRSRRADAGDVFRDRRRVCRSLCCGEEASRRRPAVGGGSCGRIRQGDLQSERRRLPLPAQSSALCERRRPLRAGRRAGRRLPWLRGAAVGLCARAGQRRSQDRAAGITHLPHSGRLAPLETFPRSRSAATTAWRSRAAERSRATLQPTSTSTLSTPAGLSASIPPRSLSPPTIPAPRQTPAGLSR